MNLPGVIHQTDGVAAQAQIDMTAAYGDLAGRTPTVTLAGAAPDISGLILNPGVYKSATSIGITGGNLILDVQGNGDALFIFQMVSTLNMGVGNQIILMNGAQANNIFWQVGSSATLGNTSIFYGSILADQSITLGIGTILNGRALARIGAVTLAGNNVITVCR